MHAKKILSALLAAGLILPSMVIGSMTEQAYNTDTWINEMTASAVSKTQKEAVNWALDCAATKWEKDVDGAFGCQCVDLILGYYTFLGVSRVSGNATDYQKNALPSGWKRGKFTPAPGDIIVWGGNTKMSAGYTTNQNGHIGIVVGVNGNTLTTVETRADGKVNYAQKMTRDASYATTFIRPDFSDVPAVTSIAVTFHSNYDTDTTKKITYKTSNTEQKFNCSFTRTGYDLKGWNLKADGSGKTYPTDATILNTWIEGNAPSIDLYAVWARSKPNWDVYKFKGSGTKEDPYQISSADELIAMQKAVNDAYYTQTYGSAFYIQTADIDLNGIDWIPIGMSYESAASETRAITPFKGTYDGNKHWITGLNVKYDRLFAGLFGRLDPGAYVHDIGVIGNVSSTTNCAGGIVGECGRAKVENCSFYGSVTGAKCVGSIVGKLIHGGTVTGCYANAEINGYGDAQTAHGGIIGQVTAGDTTTSLNADIKNCYFVGKVTSDIKTKGGIAGEVITGTANDTKTTFGACYCLKESGLEAVNSGKIEGCSAISDDMMKNADELLGSNYVKSSILQNDGYPVFAWQLKQFGDCNADGKFSIADAVMLQKWLIAESNAVLTDWKSADLCEDGVINVFDFNMMKRLIINR